MEFLKKYNHPKNIRYESFKFALLEANKRNLKIIVETGCARGKIKFIFFSKINWKDGMSTILFAHYAKENNGEFWSCDISKKNISNASFFLKKYKLDGNLVVSDSLTFLKKFNKDIDILYLDSLDGQIPGANEHQLKEAQIAISKMNDKGLIMLDDKGLKTELSLLFLQNMNWRVKYESNQQIILHKL